MTFLDRAKATAERAREQATHGIELGRNRFDDWQVHRKYTQLLEQLGEAYYAEHRGSGSRDRVARAIEDLNAYAESHPEVRTGTVLETSCTPVLSASARATAC